MPDLVTNIIVTKTKAQTENLMQLLLNDKRNVDFDLIIQTPKPLIMEQCPTAYNIIEDLACLSVLKTQDEINAIIETLTAYNETLKQPWKAGNTLFRPKDIVDMYTVNLEFNTREYMAVRLERYEANHKRAFENKVRTEQCYQNIVDHGYPHALDWRTAYWGARWNASETNLTATQISFETTYAPPVKLLESLYEKHQHDFSVYWFAEEVRTGRIDMLDKDEIEEFEDVANDLNTQWYKEIGLIDDPRNFGKLVIKNGKVKNETINVRAEKALLETMLEDE